MVSRVTVMHGVYIDRVDPLRPADVCLALLAAGLTKRCRPDQGLARIGPPIGMRVLGIVNLQISTYAKVI